jgi:hypothetical protein
MPPAQIAMFDEHRLPPGLVPPRMEIGASLNGGPVYRGAVPVRSIDTGPVPPNEAMAFVLARPQGPMLRRIGPVFGMAWALAVDAGEVVLQTGRDELSVCSLAASVVTTGTSSCRHMTIDLDEPLSALAVTPDGALIATASVSGVTLRTGTGDLLTRTPLRLIELGDGIDPRRGQGELEAVAVALSRDGGTLLALSASGVLRRWTLTPEAQIAALRALQQYREEGASIRQNKERATRSRVLFKSVD